MERAARAGWPLGRLSAGLLFVTLVLLAWASAFWLHARFGLDLEPYEYSISAWETRNFPGKWLYEAGALFRSSPGNVTRDQQIGRFLILNAALSEARPATEDLAALNDERADLENQVEDTVEARLTQVLDQLGLTRSFGPLPALVWPPVDIEYTQAPRVLAISPRDRIVLIRTTLLQPDLSLSTIESIEAKAQARENTSAIAFTSAGVGAYPAMVDFSTSYRQLLEIAAHEWTHNYLAFRPLGFNYYDNNDLRTMNETTANIVGREIAAEVARRWPIPEPSLPPATSSPPNPSVDLRAELRRLRGEVDALLAAGRIDEAEALMEQRRQELAAAGYYIRKLNQAYFAFNNLYADEGGSPAATNPIGPKIEELRRRSGSLSQFIDRVGGLTSVAELDAALARFQ